MRREQIAPFSRRRLMKKKIKFSMMRMFVQNRLWKIPHMLFILLPFAWCCLQWLVNRKTSNISLISILAQSRRLKFVFVHTSCFRTNIYPWEIKVQESRANFPAVASICCLLLFHLPPLLLLQVYVSHLNVSSCPRRNPSWKPICLAPADALAQTQGLGNIPVQMKESNHLKKS